MQHAGHNKSIQDTARTQHAGHQAGRSHSQEYTGHNKNATHRISKNETCRTQQKHTGHNKNATCRISKNKTCRTQQEDKVLQTAAASLTHTPPSPHVDEQAALDTAPPLSRTKEGEASILLHKHLQQTKHMARPSVPVLQQAARVRRACTPKTMSRARVRVARSHLQRSVGLCSL